MARTVILVTGGLGFIGSHFIKLLLEQPADWSDGKDFLILNVDNMDYAAAKGSRFGVITATPQLTVAGGPQQPHVCSRLAYLPNSAHAPSLPPEQFRNSQPDWGGHPQHWLINADLSSSNDQFLLHKLMQEHPPQYCVHFAAQSHVDRAIEASGQFVQSNVVGTHHALELTRDLPDLRKFLYVSTDEVYGSSDRVGALPFREGDRLWPRNPYAATKAAGELLAWAYLHTYKLPICITRGGNTFGTHQYPEKLIPVACAEALANRPIPLYGDGRQRRQWLHVRDHAQGILQTMLQSNPGDVFNLGGVQTLENIEVVRAILRYLKKPESLLQFVPDRPGHDRTYRVDCTKALEQLVWTPRVFGGDLHESSFQRMVEWYASAEGQCWMAYTGHDTQARLGLCGLKVSS
jgi:dTDP-glucose 4,6-dehydratase